VKELCLTDEKKKLNRIVKRITEEKRVEMEMYTAQ
jgi:hypothetical protein